MKEERINPNFDVNAKYESMIKSASNIIEHNISKNNNNGEPQDYICLAYDVKNYLADLVQENNKLKENRDKTIEFIDKYNTYFNDDISKKPNFVPYIPKEVREMLKGDK